MHKIDFGLVEWKIIADGAREKVWDGLDRDVRLLELDQRFVETEWCEKEHLGFVLEGTLDIDFNGTVERFSVGQGILIRAGEKHKAKVISPVVRIIFLEPDATTHSSVSVR